MSLNIFNDIMIKIIERITKMAESNLRVSYRYGSNQEIVRMTIFLETTEYKPKIGIINPRIIPIKFAVLSRLVMTDKKSIIDVMYPKNIIA